MREFPMQTRPMPFLQDEKRREVMDFLKRPSTLIFAGASVSAALILYVVISPGLGTNGYGRVGYDSPEDAGIVKSARNMMPKQMSSLFTFGKADESSPRASAPLEAMSGKGAAGQSLVGDAAKATSQAQSAFEGALGEVQGGPDNPAAAHGTADAATPRPAAGSAASVRRALPAPPAGAAGR